MTSPSGLYMGHTQTKAMRQLTISFGVVTGTEMISLSNWVTQCVGSGNPWIFAPDIELNGCFFCWQKSPSFSAPFRLGFYESKAIKAISRAV